MQLYSSYFTKDIYDDEMQMRSFVKTCIIYEYVAMKISVQFLRSFQVEAHNKKNLLPFISFLLITTKKKLF